MGRGGGFGFLQVVVPAGDEVCAGGVALQDQTGVGLVGGERDRGVQQWLVFDDAAGL